ncbi:hypothetical protein ANCCAN_00850 [Ancylostoma caninum]|uniref:Secreted protein n=1 Tax=Ancylostoma caninum TaxID=29170 RepID=A0A368HC87_ANCCA|nr:hypothetical protein ANCCAN_00850 [Ancylostoma caninum]
MYSPTTVLWVVTMLTILKSKNLCEAASTNRSAGLHHMDTYAMVDECRNSPAYTLHIPGKKACVWTSMQNSANELCPQYIFRIHYVSNNVSSETVIKESKEGDTQNCFWRPQSSKQNQSRSMSES